MLSNYEIIAESLRNYYLDLTNSQTHLPDKHSDYRVKFNVHLYKQ